MLVGDHIKLLNQCLQLYQNIHGRSFFDDQVPIHGKKRKELTYSQLKKGIIFPDQFCPTYHTSNGKITMKRKDTLCYSLIFDYLFIILTNYNKSMQSQMEFILFSFQLGDKRKFHSTGTHLDSLTLKQAREQLVEVVLQFYRKALIDNDLLWLGNTFFHNRMLNIIGFILHLVSDSYSVAHTQRITRKAYNKNKTSIWTNNQPILVFRFVITIFI